MPGYLETAFSRTLNCAVGDQTNKHCDVRLVWTPWMNDFVNLQCDRENMKRDSHLH